MKRKKINSIEDYVNSTKKKEDKYDKYDFLYYDPLFMTPVDGLILAIIAVVVILGAVAAAIFIH
jgi:hypothetical protein